MMYSCNESNDFFHTFLTLTYPSAYYMLYRNMSIYCNTLGAIYRYGKIQYRPSSNTLSLCRNIYHIVAKECPSVVPLTSTCTWSSIVYMYTHNCMCNVLNKHSASTLSWGIVPWHTCILTLHLLELVMCAYDCMGTVYMYVQQYIHLYEHASEYMYMCVCAFLSVWLCLCTSCTVVHLSVCV